MSALDGSTVAGAAATAGFSGENLVTIVAIGKRESGWDDTAQGDITIQTAEWGPSVGVWQIRTVKAATGTGADRDLQALIPGAIAGVPGSGHGDLARQARAAFAIAGGGANFGPWSTYAGLSNADLDAARSAIAGSSTASASSSDAGKLRGTIGGGSGDLGANIGDAIDRALGAVLGYDGTFTEWATMVVVRTLEVIGGGVILAAGVLAFLDVIGYRESAGGQGTGLIVRVARQGFALAKDAAVAAAA